MKFVHLQPPFKFALVGKLCGHRSSLDGIQNFFFNLKLLGDFFVTLLNPKHVLIKSANDLDYCRVFSHRSYFVSKCLNGLLFLILVFFPNLKPHLFFSRILHGLGSIFVRPLKTDNATSSGSRPSVAHVLVELDVTKYYPDIVWVRLENLGYIQSMIMEDFSS
ncbi:hypothetical protein IEQ34_013554 [Dendrobium chrysotoxum]|uniref:Uncharacterized protein n=1 Tax=Dendrobium chrysotoxum TaxID=161865 RepID=A0AAV7GRY8_DENCH|nr:hypothetical protein IEQ34_013554 [Dendrobium chrysotoxum]